MRLDNISSFFKTTTRISNLNSLDEQAIWPKGIDICLCRVPIRKKDGYSLKSMQELAAKLKTHMTKNGIVFFICYAPAEAKARPFEISDVMIKAGFTHIDNIVIQKTWFPGKRSEVNLVNSHEYVLYFCNGTVWKLDRFPIREYLVTPDEVSCPGNTWKVDTGSLEESYPIELAELLIKMTDCLPGATVFDPFMSTKSSLRAAVSLGHSFYGFDMDSARVKQYQALISNWKSKNER